MKKFIFLFVCLLFAFGVNAQITREQADAIVTNQIYGDAIDHIDVFKYPQLLSNADSIPVFGQSPLAMPYQYGWAYFVDFLPFANWSHPCNYCLIDSSTGQHTIIENDMLPKHLDEYEIVSLMDRPQPADFTPIDNPEVQKDIPPQNPHLWAVLICGEVGDYADSFGRFWGDLSCVYNVLIKNGYVPNTALTDDNFNGHIFVLPNPSIYNQLSHDLDNNGISDFYSDFGWEYNKMNLQNLLEKFQLGHEWELTPDDKLFIYVTGHGEISSSTNESYFQMNPHGIFTGNAVYSSDLSEWLSGVNCSQIVLLMQNCHSGGFIADFMNVSDAVCKNRAVFTATNSSGYSWAETYITATLGANKESEVIKQFNVDEFTYYWSAAALGYYPHIFNRYNSSWGPWEYVGYGMVDGTNTSHQMPWNQFFSESEDLNHNQSDHDPDTDCDKILSLKEQFTFANDLDTWSEDGYFCPSFTFAQGFEDVQDHPQSQFESTFTSEAITLRGYEGQVDGLGVNSGTATQPYRLCGDLWVGPDSDLTMWDDIYVPEDAKIYIKPTGMLTMDGCTFDKLPETDRGMWQGVQVWGNKNLDQGSHNRKYKQGYLEMKNGATISNAIVGVDLWDPWDYQTTGGIIKATDANFINNAKGVRIEEYLYYYPDNNPATGTELNYNSSFTRCRFEVNGDFIGTEPFYEHVKLSKVKGITFNGCEFILRNPNSHVVTWAKGLLAHDASFSINSSYDLHSNLIRQAVFDGLYMGVEALGDGSSPITTRSFSIKNTDFTNNDCGVFARATGYPTVINCNFAVGRGDSDCAMGIYAEGINDFAIENNHFEPAQICPDDSFGIVVKDSNTSETQIYQNDFESLYCGNLAIGDNRENSNNGLEYRCNQNTLNVIDFYVKEGSNLYTTDINSEQGGKLMAADNTFSIGGYHFYNGGFHNLEYFYQDDVENEEPINFNDKVFVSATTQTDNCPPHYGNGGGSSNGGSTPVLSDTQKYQRETDYYNAYSTYNSVKNLYDRLTDGGSTHSTVADIRTASSYDMWNLRAKLLGASPYLSEEVLKEAADRDDVFTESVLFEILASNPDELRKSDIISYVENKTHPLPQYMTDILKQMASGTTYKTVLLNQMANYSHDYRLAAADMVRSILNDSVVDVDELRGWLSNMNDIASDREIISTYMAEGDFNTAFSLADMLPSLYHLEGDDLDAHDDYMELLRLYRNLYNEGRNTMQMDSTEIALVETIAYGSNGTPKHMAQSILEGAYRYHFEECPVVPYPGNERGGCVENIDSQSYGKAMGLSIDVKPNPATTWTAIDFTLPTNATTAMFNITDNLGNNVLQLQLNGNVGQKVLDLRELANGVYICTVVCGEYSMTKKLVITK